MAEAAFSFAVQKLGQLAIQKVGFLQGVEAQVNWLKDELETMQCFLKDAAEKQADNQSIRKWISDIRDLAQDADDVIETFILKIDAPRRSRGLIGRFAYLPRHVYHLDRVGEEIERIRSKLDALAKSRERYGIEEITEEKSEDAEYRRRFSPWQKDKQVVGMEEDVEILLRRSILEEREGLSVASIVGMGGIGKSTLARVVYNHAAVSGRFERRAWICVSSEFKEREIIKELVLQLVGPTEDKLKIVETMEKLEVPSLREMLYKRLQGTRYFVVVDDVWEEEHWECLAAVFPCEEEKNKRSCKKMASCGSSSEAEGTTDFRCVQCGFPIKTLYIQYSRGNIRLMRCGNCRAVADEYIECEVMILIIDLILHKPKAYRHLFYNMFSKETVNFESLLWKLVFSYLILDLYRMWVLNTNEKEGRAPASVASLLLDFGKMLTGVIFGNLIFLSVVFHATRKFLSASAGLYGWKQMLLVVLFSSYFKIFLMAMMVWEFPSSVVFIIDIFVISSNTVALKVMTNTVMVRCLSVCAMAHGVKFLGSQILQTQVTRMPQ